MRHCRRWRAAREDEWLGLRVLTKGETATDGCGSGQVRGMTMAQSVRRIRNRVFALGGVALTAAALAACGSSSSSTPASSSKFTGTVTIGVDTATSGFFGESGVDGDDGITMAVNTINKSGGLLGKKVDVVFRNDNASVPTAISNTQSMIQNDHVVALLGASTSSTVGAMESLATQYKIPLMIWNGNDIATVTKDYSKYAFQLQPNTYMEPLGAAQYLSKLPFRRYYFITPDYSFGRDDIDSFQASMKSLGIHLINLGVSYTQIGQPSFTSDISAALATHPQMIFLGIFGGDEVTFIRQAESYNLFSKTAVFGPTGTDTLLALKGSTPTKNLYLNDRAPFFAIHSAAMTSFTNEFHKLYGSWPSEWAILAYSAVQTWAQGVQKAHSFGGNAVSAALKGATIHSLRGTFQIEACDNQAVVPDYFGKVSSTILPKYGFPLLTDLFVSSPTKTLMSCSEALSLRG
jgi:branched-chain amino acid transport system substrate-binding protein